MEAPRQTQTKKRDQKNTKQSSRTDSEERVLTFSEKPSERYDKCQQSENNKHAEERNHRIETEDRHPKTCLAGCGCGGGSENSSNEALRRTQPPNNKNREAGVSGPNSFQSERGDSGRQKRVVGSGDGGGRTTKKNKKQTTKTNDRSESVCNSCE